jgi:glucose/arabinose dehydrogenase
MRLKNFSLISIALLSLATSAARAQTASTAPALGATATVPAFTIRPGYTVTLAYPINLGEARFITFGETPDTLFLSQPNRGRILCLRDLDPATGQYKTVTNFVTGKKTVHGMQWYKGELWFTQSDSIHRARSTKNDGVADEIEDVLTDLPQGGGHWWRTILVDDNGFYTSIGDDGNMNDHTGDDREKIWHYSLDGSDKKLFCSGLRNTEKLLYRPGTKEIWGCDHGSDNFGAKLGEHLNKFQQPVTDLNPPEEFNHYVEGGFYGHPFVVGNRIPRYEYMDRPDIMELVTKTIPPEWCGHAHWANCGWTFVNDDKLTGQAGDAIIAYHGSWNSEVKTGYCVQRIEFDPMTGHPCGSMPLVQGLTPDNQTVLARPVDALEAPDGSLLWTSDSASPAPGRNARGEGKLYRLTRTR